MRRWILAALGVVVVAGIAAAAVFPIDLSAFRGEAAGRVASRLGQPVDIDGDVTLRILPRPSIVARGVVVGRKADRSGTIASINRISADIAPWPLLGGRLDLSHLTATGVKIHGDALMSAATSRAPRVLAPLAAAEGEGAPVQRARRVRSRIEATTINALTISLPSEDPWNGRSITINRVQIEPVGDNRPIALTVEARVGETPLSLSLATQPLEGFQGSRQEPIPVSAEAHFPGGQISIKGDVTRGATVVRSAADLAVVVDVSDLRESGIGRDNDGRPVGPIRATGHLRAVDGTATLEVPDGILGTGDITGRATLDLAGGRPRVDVAGHAALLDLDPVLAVARWASAIVEHSSLGYRLMEDSGMIDIDAPGGGDRVASPPPIPLAAIDGQLSFQAERVIAGQFSAENVAARATLANGQLVMSPLTARVFGGDVTGSVSVESGPPLNLSVEATGKQLRVRGLFLATDIPTLFYGKADGTMNLHATASTPGALPSALAGSLNLHMTGGRIVPKILDILAVGLGSAPGGDDDRGRLRCAFADVSVNAGVADLQAVMASRELTILAGGQVDVARRLLDVNIEPRVRDPLYLPLDRLPVHVTGPFLKPVVDVGDAEKGPDGHWRIKSAQDLVVEGFAMLRTLGKERRDNPSMVPIGDGTDWCETAAAGRNGIQR